MNKKVILGLLITLVIAIGVGITANHLSKGQVAGNIAPTDLTATNFTEVTASTGLQSPVVQIGNGTLVGSVTESVSTGSCQTGTTTLVSLVNPFNATSSATLQSISGVGNATSTSLYFGTSTSPSPTLSSNVSASMVNNANLGTSTGFFVASGATSGPLGFVSSGSGTSRTVYVGPSDYLVGFATTTYTNAGAINFSPGMSSCSYKVRWQN